ncbi:MAG: hypothetical protein U5N21_24920 [Rhodococcus sp. (in: high G+C Gram-positive bacteria)]|nr:hypothetical protein [Rhodococcus sp. (in: high G+C Gram-positive bacteria)]
MALSDDIAALPVVVNDGDLQHNSHHVTLHKAAKAHETRLSELNRVDNTRDVDKPISTDTQSAFDYMSAAFGAIVDGVNADLELKQDAAQVSAAVSAKIAVLVGEAPATLDTIYEIAAALAVEQSAVAALTAAIGLRAMADAVVNLVGNQTISGTKNFTGILQQSGKAVVVTDDSRLSNARTPTTHTHDPEEIDGLVTEFSNIAGQLMGKVNSYPGQTIFNWAGTQAAYDALPTGEKTAAGFIAAIF